MNLDLDRIITSPPYSLSSCNDYIFIPCMWIKDTSLVDIIPREECFLNLNFMNIVVYNVSHPDYVFEFLSMDRANLPAKLVRGDPRCVTVDNIDMSNPINVCLKTSVEARQIVEAIHFFGSCRNRIRFGKRLNCPDVNNKLFILMKNSTNLNSYNRLRSDSLFKGKNLKNIK